LASADYHSRRIHTGYASDGYERTGPQPVHEYSPSSSSSSDSFVISRAAILDALMAIVNEEIEASKDLYSTTTTSASPPARHYVPRDDGPDVLMMLISGFVLIGLIFVIG
ncbi:hypothetical protein PFISCL1PPCAC_7264, partial [Pristionchus fissidentatus]